MNPVISIVVPVYNAADTLDVGIGSILGQTFTDWELILVNDGSDDSSGILCDRYAQADSRIRVLHQENRGVSTARNQGIRAACGSYICFMDSDDRIAPGMLGDMVAAMTQTNADLIICGLAYEFEESGLSRAYTVREGRIDLPSGLNERYRELADARLLNSHCGKLFRKGIIDRYSLCMEEGISTLEDGIFVLDYLTHCASVYCLSSAAYHYRQTAQPSLQRRYSPTALDAWSLYVQCYRRLAEQLDKENSLSVYGMLWHRYRWFLTDVYARSGMPNPQKRLHLQAFVEAIHGLCFFKDLPRCPEKGFIKHLFFACIQRKRILLLHMLLCLRFPASS